MPFSRGCKDGISIARKSCCTFSCRHSSYCTSWQYRTSSGISFLLSNPRMVPELSEVGWSEAGLEVGSGVRQLVQTDFWDTHLYPLSIWPNRWHLEKWVVVNISIFSSLGVQSVIRIGTHERHLRRLRGILPGHIGDQTRWRQQAHNSCKWLWIYAFVMILFHYLGRY